MIGLVVAGALLALCLAWLGRALCRSYTRFVMLSGLRQKALAVGALPAWQRYLFYLAGWTVLLTVWAFALRQQGIG
ncbi:MAG: hypothetical protein JO256_08155 [Alphaproteobacteria bacterium]|nr:hypothetical protein [Alphaproteobacteria bacterium]